MLNLLMAERGKGFKERGYKEIDDHPQETELFPFFYFLLSQKRIALIRFVLRIVFKTPMCGQRYPSFTAMTGLEI